MLCFFILFTHSRTSLKIGDKLYHWLRSWVYITSYIFIASTKLQRLYQELKLSLQNTFLLLSKVWLLLCQQGRTMDQKATHSVITAMHGDFWSKHLSSAQWAGPTEYSGRLKIISKWQQMLSVFQCWRIFKYVT